MTDLKDTLAALSAKATQGEWLTQATDTVGPDYGVGIVADNLGGLVSAALPWPTEIDNGNFSRVEANAAFIVALVNAYRSGQLVPVDDVYRLGMADGKHDAEGRAAVDTNALLREIVELRKPIQAMVDDHQVSEKHHPNHVLVTCEAFEAAIAAMKGEGRGDV